MRYFLALTLSLAMISAACTQQRPPQANPDPVVKDPPLAPITGGPLPTPGARSVDPITGGGETEPISPTSGAKSYTVKKGDTMYSIARSVFGDQKRAKDIIAANPGIDANKLKIGQVINLPAK